MARHAITWQCLPTSRALTRAASRDVQHALALGASLGASEISDSALDGGRYTHLLPGAHRGRIVALSAAVSKPLLASCGDDFTVRVWEWRPGVGGQASCMLVAALPEQAFQ